MVIMRKHVRKAAALVMVSGAAFVGAILVSAGDPATGPDGTRVTVGAVGIAPTGEDNREYGIDSAESRDW
jgi:hypothetical protein